MTDESGASGEAELVTSVLDDVRRGCVQRGAVYVAPNSWAGALVQPKPSTQVNIEKFMESCSFKIGMAGVMGKFFFMFCYAKVVKKNRQLGNSARGCLILTLQFGTAT